VQITWCPCGGLSRNDTLFRTALYRGGSRKYSRDRRMRRRRWWHVAESVARTCSRADTCSNARSNADADADADARARANTDPNALTERQHDDYDSGRRHRLTENVNRGGG